jgi:ubiquinone/menaquinone biosynthesis C-methylase UbiE
LARILDLGCGQGRFLKKVQLSDEDTVCGIDICYEDLRIAKLDHPGHNFCCARGESIPLRSESIDRVICNVALPYMDIPAVLGEMYRITKPGATAYISLHNLKFTLAEFKIAVPRLISVLFRMYVLFNGAVFHATGKLLPFVTGRIESWQSESAIRGALARAGFTDIRVNHPDGMFVVDARRI